MLRDGDVVEIDEARAGDVHPLVLAIAADVKENEVGIVQVLGEPGGVDEHLVALGARRHGKA
jgi:hypothetical protein